MINKSELMTTAWALYRKFAKLATKLSFGECLRRAWAEAKRNARKFGGYVTINSVDGKITVDALFGRVYGKTYGWRKTLKDFGAIWCPEDHEWALPLDRVQEFCRKYA
jgi:hypothetical protein